MQTTNNFDFTQVLNIFWRRKGVIIASFVVASSLAAYLAVSLPDIYQSTTLILITPQKLPNSYVNSTVTMSIQERVYTITQEILSRTRLEKIIKEFGLYSPARQGSRIGERVKKLRKNIRIDTRQRESSFRLSFESESPKKAQQVTARLAFVFIEENLQLREQRAAGTTVFIKAEADRIRKEVEKQEAQVNLYKAKHRYEIPGQIQVNLSTLEQHRGELQSNLLRLSALQGRKASLEKQLVEAEQIGQEIGKTEDGGGETTLPRWLHIEGMKTQLETLLTRYSEKHPDVLRLKQEIQAFDLRGHEGEEDNSASTMNPVRQMLLKQVKDLNSEIKSVQSNSEMQRNKIALYQARVDNTPVHAIEISRITRTYNVTQRKYQDLLAKLLDSQLSENMEKKQKAEQFQVVDPANFPQEPVRPNRPLIFLMGLILGFGAGFGLAFVLETMDSSLKSGDELTGYISVPLLATIPAFTTRATVLQKRRQRAILALTSVGSLTVGLVGIRFYVQYFA